MTRLMRRHRLWLIPGLALAIVANAEAGGHDIWIGLVILFGIVPHLPVLLGIGQPRPRGHIGSRAVPLFNAFHQPLVPAAVVVVALTRVLDPIWLVAGLAWLGHIVLDWGLGDGHRAADGGHAPTLPSRLVRMALPPPAPWSRTAGG